MNSVIKKKQKQKGTGLTRLTTCGVVAKQSGCALVKSLSAWLVDGVATSARRGVRSCCAAKGQKQKKMMAAKRGLGKRRTIP